MPYLTGRRCRRCNTILSRFNDGDICAVHEQLEQDNANARAAAELGRIERTEDALRRLGIDPTAGYVPAEDAATIGARIRRARRAITAGPEAVVNYVLGDPMP